ncbi:MAG: glycoside hydrolase family 25 protein [Lachnospiraceae bacterium]|nr:glycoside hydrolase family 25 protein [Lachnospiraceae bacterium]
MEQEEIIGQLKKHLKLWRTISWALTILLIVAAVVAVFMWQQTQKPEKEPEEPAPTRALYIENPQERVDAFNRENEHCEAKLETILGWQYITVQYESGVKLSARNEYPVVEGTTQPDTAEGTLSAILSDGSRVKECVNKITVGNIFEAASVPTIRFNGIDYLPVDSADGTYNFINLKTMEEATSVKFEELVKKYFEVKMNEENNVSVKAGGAEFIFDSDTAEVSLPGFRIERNPDGLYVISCPVGLGDGEYIGYIDGMIAPSGDRYAFIEAKFGAYVGLEYEDPDSTKIIKPIAEPIENPVVLSATGSGRYYLPRYKNVSNYEFNWDNLKIYDDGFREMTDDEGNVISKMGIDVSHHNNNKGKIDWQQVKAAGIDFAIIRLGYRGTGEGTLEPDNYAEENVKGASAAGLDIGVYFYTQAITEAEAIAEADYLLNKVKEYGVEVKLPIVIDTELYETKKTARGNMISRAQRTKCLKAFCERVEKAGYTPMVYASTRWSIMSYDRDELAKYPFWFAFYGEKVSYRFDFCIWQYTSEGKVPGITGDVDLDIMLMEPKMQQ